MNALFLLLAVLVPVGWAAAAGPEELRLPAGPGATVLAPRSLAGLARRVQAGLPRRVGEVAAALEMRWEPALTLVLVPGREDLEKRFRVRIPVWAAAVTLPERRVIGLIASALRSGGHELAVVLRHELAHLALHDALGPGARLPRWLEEGVCQWVAGRPYLGVREELLAHLSFDELLPWSQLGRSFPASPAAARRAYLQSYYFVAYLIRTRGFPFLRPVLERAARGEPVSEVLLALTGKAQVELEAEWMAYERRRSLWFLFLLEAASPLALAAVLAVMAYHRRRVRDRQLLERMAAEEAAAGGLAAGPNREIGVEP